MNSEDAVAHSTSEAAQKPDVVGQSLGHLLAMADRYRQDGNISQAMELYWKLSEDYPGTAQSLEAEKHLLQLAEAYDCEKSRHRARAIYERLLASS